MDDFNLSKKPVIVVGQATNNGGSKIYFKRWSVGTPTMAKKNLMHHLNFLKKLFIVVGQATTMAVNA